MENKKQSDAERLYNSIMITFMVNFVVFGFLGFNSHGIESMIAMAISSFCLTSFIVFIFNK